MLVGPEGLPRLRPRPRFCCKGTEMDKGEIRGRGKEIDMRERRGVRIRGRETGIEMKTRGRVKIKGRETDIEMGKRRRVRIRAREEIDMLREGGERKRG